MRWPTQIAEIATRDQRFASTPVLTYVANAIRIGEREIPYSTVTGDRFPDASCTEPRKDPDPYLAQRMGGGGPGREGRRRRHARLFPLVRRGRPRTTTSAQFTLAGVVPMTGLGGDSTLTPEYPGISDAADITSWDPPFPVDLERVRQEGRRLLGSIPRGAKGDRLGRRRAAVVGLAIRQGVVAAAVGQRADRSAGNRSGGRAGSPSAMSALMR